MQSPPPTGPARMNLDRVRLWLMLLPCLLAYLVTDRGIKALLIVPLMWFLADMAANWKSLWKEIDTRLLSAMALYLLIVASSVFSGALYADERILFRDVFIIASSIALFLFPKKDIHAPVLLFLGFVGAYLFSLVGKNLDPSKLTDMISYRIFLPSTAATENDFGIVFGLFTVHFFLKKSWPMFLGSLLVSLMVSKRALLVGLIMSVGWWVVVGASRKISSGFKSATLLALYLSLMSASLFITELGTGILKLFGIEKMNVARFLMGRNSLLLALRSKLDLSSFTSIFGHGPGSADTYLAFNGVGWGPISDTPFNPHNDYMKIIFDYGIFGYLVFFAILLKFYGGTDKGKALLVYTVTVFCFDNALIFMVFHIVAGFMCAEYARVEKDAKQAVA